jgi:catechol 2,3-dioxygenase-like lactoylglutathione lyase family enzyme
MLHHLAIKVRDLAAAEHFYCGLLGLPVQRRWPSTDGQGPRSLWLDLGAGAFLALERATLAREPLAEDDPGLHMVALRIERHERQEWIDRLGVAGVTPYRQTDYTIYVRDPEGNRIGLSHWPESSAAK